MNPLIRTLFSIVNPIILYNPHLAEPWDLEEIWIQRASCKLYRIFHSTEDGCLHPHVVPGLIIFYLRTTPSLPVSTCDYSGDGVVRNKGLNSPVACTAHLT